MNKKDFLKQNFEEVLLEIIFNKQIDDNEKVEKILDEFTELEEIFKSTIVPQFNCSVVLVSNDDVTRILDKKFWHGVYGKIVKTLKKYDKKIRVENACLQLGSKISFEK